MLEAQIEAWIDALVQAGSSAPGLLLPPAQVDLSVIAQHANMALHEDLVTLFNRVPGYDATKLGGGSDADASPFLPRMPPLRVSKLKNAVFDLHYSYGPGGEGLPFGSGFVPLAEELERSYILFNADPKSPSFGAVFDFVIGDGAMRIADDLGQYFETLTKMLGQDALFVQDGRLCEDPQAFWTGWYESTGLPVPRQFAVVDW